MYKLLGTNLLLTMPGFFYVNYIIFIFIGSPFIFIDNGADNYLYIISTNLLLIIFPIGIGIVNRLMAKDYPAGLSSFLNKPVVDNQSGKHYSLLYLLILAVSITVTFVYYSKLGVIPINYLLSNLSDQLDIGKLAKLREISTTTFKLGKLHRYKFFMAQMIPLLVIISYIKYKVSKGSFWRIQFYILTVFAMYRSISDLQKKPIIDFIILLFILFWIFRGKINLIQVGGLLSIIVTLLSFMYYYIMGINQGSLLPIFMSIGRRLFFSQTYALYHYFSLFPSSHEFLYGLSLPNPAGIFQFETFTITKWIFTAIHGSSQIVGTAPTVFIGEMYANFGFPIMVLSILLFSMVLQYIQIKFTYKSRTVLLTSFYTYFVFLSGQFALTGIFVVVHLYLFIFLFTAIILVDGSKILTSTLNSSE
jgi:hypothetical protein